MQYLRFERKNLFWLAVLYRFLPGFETNIRYQIARLAFQLNGNDFISEMKIDVSIGAETWLTYSEHDSVITSEKGSSQSQLFSLRAPNVPTFKGGGESHDEDEKETFTCKHLTNVGTLSNLPRLVPTTRSGPCTARKCDESVLHASRD